MPLSKEACLKINITQAIRENGISDTLDCLIKVIDDRYVCQNLGSNPPASADCECSICTGLIDITSRLEEASTLVRVEEIDSMQRDGV